MRMVRMSLCTGLLVACGLMVSAAERAQEPQRSYTKASLREASVEAAPDEAPLPVDDALASIAAAASACEPIGAFNNQFAGANRFRGDVFFITKQVDLVGIEMELAFRTTTDNPLELFFYVFGDSASDPANDPPIFDIVIFESTISATGDGLPTFYESGVVEASGGAPLTLFAGNRYAIGAAWTSASGSPSTIIYGSDGLTYPRPFGAGQVEGLVSVNQAPPLTTLGTPVIFTSSGAYSLRLCLAGACCVPVTGCENLSKFDCDSTGGDFTAGGVTCAEDINTCPLAQGACCIDGEACLVRNEFSCAANGGAWTEGVACDDPTEPCAPTGGCCLPDQKPPSPPCTVKTENSCALSRGTYRGDGVACDASPGCGAGACCVEETCAELTRANCESQIDGLYSGPGTSCNADICVPTGACCDGETCRDLTEEDCALVFGASFRGDGTSCGETLAPACGNGACCLPGAGCFDGGGQGVLQQFCENQNGDFRGDGTSCATISPACEGVCCLTNPSFCAVQVSPEECWFDSAGQFAGYFSDGCTSDPCPVPTPSLACCLRSGGCTVTDEETCGILVGQFQVDESCDTVVCSIQGPLGVCCDPSDNACDNNSGNGKEKSSCPENWIEGVVPCVSPNPCLPVGACCDGTSCTGDGGGDNEDDCDGVNPAWIENATCLDIPDPCAPTGSCCNLATFECFENLVADACVGSWIYVEGGICEEADCTAPTGACCAITSAVAPPCSQQTQADCDLVGGRYHGDDVECIDVICGACCQLIGTCQDNVLDSDCTLLEFNEGVGCGVVCTPRGACCAAGTCNDGKTELECGTGDYAGDGTLCSDGGCDVGACCRTDETCVDAADSDTIRTVCEAGGGRFLDAGSTCSSPTDEVCKRGVCCEPDATCTGDKIVLDCANPEEFVPGSPSCDTAGCLVRGACCLDDQPCQLSSQVTCGVSGGNFAGNRTGCETDLCTVGACCDAGSSCTESTTLSCTQSSGTYAGPGSECLSSAPPDDCSTPRGACCNGGTCLIETKANCVGGGSYAGDNVACDVVDLCRIGACCLLAGGCDDSSTQIECEGNGGTFLGFGISCLGTADECTTGSCCGLDGTCADGVAAEVCAAEGGSFNNSLNCIGVGSSCEARGCCCDGGSASIKTEAACTGTYLGDGKSCVGVDCGIGACCSGDSPCTEVSQASCAAVDDNYFGDGTTCVVGVCATGACCSPQEICSVTSRLNCQQSGGFPLPGGTDCASDPDICLPRGACCVDGTCNDLLTQIACGDAGGLYIGDDTFCSGGACDVGACCNGESPCAEVSRASCSAADDNYFGDGTTCAGLGVECTVGACCSDDESCSEMSKAACESLAGIHQLGGTDCASSSCVISILSSTPESGAIDARQPSEPEPTAPEAIVLTGWDQFDVDFTGNPALLAPQDFVVELNPGGAGVAVPSIVGVVVTGTGAVIQLDQPIPVGQWTIVRHLSSNTITWLGNLPGDVNANAVVVGSFEVSAMVGCLNSPGTCNLWQCDANRSGACTPADLLRLIDIVTDIGAYAGLGAGSLPVFP
ncbi:MAG: hypothetical protein IH989_01620 [Planctomycetes bacterium]|nr:hypothetical protein [Planctomycetota bacterium]